MNVDGLGENRKYTMPRAKLLKAEFRSRSGNFIARGTPTSEIESSWSQLPAVCEKRALPPDKRPKKEPSPMNPYRPGEDVAADPAGTRPLGRFMRTEVSKT